MAPSNANGGIRVLQQGIDTLVLNVYGELREDVVLLLQVAKEDAQAADDDWALSPLPAFDGTYLRVHASGVKYYDYHLRSRDLTVKIRKPGRSPLPPVVVRVSAAALWRLGGGGRGAGDLVAAWVGELFDGWHRVQLQRFDLATDYQGRAIVAGDLAGVVKRADTFEVHYGDDGEIETVAAGRSDRLRLNSYNKTRQARKKGLDWLFDLWAAGGAYDALEDGWRLEYQCGREFLRERGIETLDDLWEKLPAVWAYCCEWFSFRVVNPGDMLHRHRWDVTAWWGVLSTWGGAIAGELARVKQVRPQFHRLCLAAAGYLSSIMALADTESAGDGLGAVLHVLGSVKGPDALSRALERKRLRFGAYTMAVG